MLQSPNSSPFGDSALIAQTKTWRDKLCKPCGEPSWPREFTTLASAVIEEIALRMSGWGIITIGAMSISAAALPARNDSPGQIALAQSTGFEPAYGQSAPAMDPWYGYKLRLAALARQQGVSEATIQSNVPGIIKNDRVIALERDEPVARTSNGVVGALAPYLRSHVTSSLVSRGRANYSTLYGGLRAIEGRYGVDAAVLLAIYGHETSYGLVTGRTDLLEALASLGYYGRRRGFFEGEFVSALKLMDQGVPRWRLKGSWAGATGFPQFMPSVALRLRADGNGDGYANIWSDELDGLASIAGVRVLGPLDTHDRRGVVSFSVEGFSAEEVCRSLDTRGVALRGGHHCAQPLVRAFGVDGAARASLAPYSVDGDIDVLLGGLEELVGSRSAHTSRRGRGPPGKCRVL